MLRQLPCARHALPRVKRTRVVHSRLLYPLPLEGLVPCHPSDGHPSVELPRGAAACVSSARISARASALTSGARWVTAMMNGRAHH
eukprot:scaffold2809_cov373-Prasinococcus_capsulatus_cf.AAC.5